MSKKIFYAVKSENNPMIFKSWEECQKCVKGTKTKYQGFVTREEAEAWLDGKDIAEEKFKKDLEKYDGVTDYIISNFFVVKFIIGINY